MGETIPNKTIEDAAERRRVVLALMAQRRYRFTLHAQQTHPEIPRQAKIDAIRFGALDRPNHPAAPERPSYVCWYDDPTHGLLRAVYAIREPPPGGRVVIITVFPE